MRRLLQFAAVIVTVCLLAGGCGDNPVTQRPSYERDFERLPRPRPALNAPAMDAVHADSQGEANLGARPGE